MTLNAQLSKRSDGSINPGIGWTHAAFGLGSGYTANPFKGCHHGCEWRMPNGDMAICYAKTIAESLHTKNPALYPDGFEVSEFDPDVLKAILKRKQSSGIFVDSMSDFLAKEHTDDQVQQCLSAFSDAYWHRFMILTKNIGRLTKFSYPQNCWVGASVPPTMMYGKELSPEQQAAYMRKALTSLSEINAPVRWLSAEPLSFDISPYLWEMYLNTPSDRWINWAVIGAASSVSPTGKRLLFQPNPVWVHSALEVLDAMGCPVFFKENLDWILDRSESPLEAYNYEVFDPSKQIYTGKLALGGNHISVSRKLNIFGEPIVSLYENSILMRATNEEKEITETTVQ